MRKSSITRARVVRVLALGAIATTIGLGGAGCGPDKHTASPRGLPDEAADNRRFLDQNLDQVMQERERLAQQSNQW
jgi:hypothetical protein